MNVDPTLARHLADAVLALHVAIASFVVGGLVATVVGNVRHWRWVDDPRFRLAHLAAIVIVASQAWLGIVCPLTTLEMGLRQRAGVAAYGGGFIEHWMDRILYVTAPPWAFTAAYTLFALLVIATWWLHPPRRLRSERGERGERGAA